MEQKFGLNQVYSTTPLWAKWFFRIVFLLTKIAVGYIAATNLITPDTKYEITLFLTLVVDPVAFFFSKMFGISPNENINEDQFQANDIGGSTPPPSKDEK